MESSYNNLSDKQLKLSYWYITHKLFIRKLAIGFLIVLCSLLFLYVGLYIIFWGLSYEKEQAKLLSLREFPAYQIENIKPLSLQFSSIRQLNSGSGKNDYLISANNPNPDWLAEFSYRIVSTDNKWQNAFVLPGESSYLFALGEVGSVKQIETKNLQWRKINNYRRKKSDRYRFEILNKEYVKAPAGEGGAVRFDAVNNSAYSYWETGFLVFLYGASEPFTANYIVLDEFKSGQTRNIEIFWHYDLPTVRKIEIIPVVNFLDENNIMDPEGELEDRI